MGLAQRDQCSVALVARNARANRNVLGNTQATTPTLSIVIFLFLSIRIRRLRNLWPIAPQGAPTVSCVEELPLRPCDLRPLWPLSQVEMGTWGRSSRISNPKPQRYSWAGARLNVCNTTVSCAGGVHFRVLFSKQLTSMVNTLRSNGEGTRLASTPALSSTSKSPLFLFFLPICGLKAHLTRGGCRYRLVSWGTLAGITPSLLANHTFSTLNSTYKQFGPFSFVKSSSNLFSVQPNYPYRYVLSNSSLRTFSANNNSQT